MLPDHGGQSSIGSPTRRQISTRQKVEIVIRLQGWQEPVDRVGQRTRRTQSTIYPEAATRCRCRRAAFGADPAASGARPGGQGQGSSSSGSARSLSPTEHRP
jgi:hypothetical protein